VRWEVKELDNPANDWVQERRLDNLVMLYFDKANSAAAHGRIKKFVDDNKARFPNVDLFVWPFTLGLAITLWTREGGDQYCTDLMRKWPDRKPGIGLDWSYQRRVDEAGTAGFWPKPFENLADDDPLLWPRQKPFGWNEPDWEKSARLDPSDPL